MISHNQVDSLVPIRSLFHFSQMLDKYDDVDHEIAVQSSTTKLTNVCCKQNMNKAADDEY